MLLTFYALIFGHTGDFIKEGPCITPKVVANLPPNFVNDNQPDGGYYLPFNNQAQAIFIAQAILGRKLTKDDDMKKYCPRLTWKWTSENGVSKNIGEFSGFGGNKTSLTCENLDMVGEYQRCMAKHKTGLEAGGEFHVTLTDAKSYFVLFICTPDPSQQAFNVLSIKPKLTEEEIKCISEHVRQLGLDPSKFNIVDYSNC